MWTPLSVANEHNCNTKSATKNRTPEKTTPKKLIHQCPLYTHTLTHSHTVTKHPPKSITFISITETRQRETVDIRLSCVWCSSIVCLLISIIVYVCGLSLLSDETKKQHPTGGEACGSGSSVFSSSSCSSINVPKCLCLLLMVFMCLLRFSVGESQ